MAPTTWEAYCLSERIYSHALQYRRNFTSCFFVNSQVAPSCVNSIDETEPSFILLSA